MSMLLRAAAALALAAADERPPSEGCAGALEWISEIYSYPTGGAMVYSGMQNACLMYNGKRGRETVRGRYIG